MAELILEGLGTLTKAFAVADVELKKELRVSLREAAEPVRRAAEAKAVSNIRNMGAGRPWSQMRVGVTTHTVYVAPRERGRTGRTSQNVRRPNLKPLLLDRALNPALAEHTPEVIAAVEGMLGRIGRTWVAV